MLNRDLDRERPEPPRRKRWGTTTEVSLQNEGLTAFRRAYRWLNLTLMQHGVWPLLVIVFQAPPTTVGLTPLPWFWLRAGAPLLAALLALAYLAQRPEGLPSDMTLRAAGSGSDRDRLLREQATILMVGVAVAVFILRLLQGPLEPVAKLGMFGLAEVAAYQAINFGLVGSRASSGVGRALPVVLFGLSWGLRDLFLAAASPAAEQLLLSFGSGAAVGLAFGVLSWLFRLWPGGFLTASAFQFLVVYLVLGYV